MRISDWSSDVCSSDLGWRRTSLEYSDLLADVIIHEGDNVSRYGYGELSLPLLDQLLLNAAVRYEDYDSFGGTTTPKRSEERRVGKECVSTCRSRWSP